ncbi:MAG: hypothetical protein ACLRXH_05070 [Monoglobus pectinilyticus]|uniref:hypothetical protein n=1 Tax=Monoglobus pectinilyticus TaxID=1981510 RepID=UPI0039A308FD
MPRGTGQVSVIGSSANPSETSIFISMPSIIQELTTIKYVASSPAMIGSSPDSR